MSSLLTIKNRLLAFIEKLKNFWLLSKSKIINAGLSVLLFLIIIVNSGYTLTYLISDTLVKSIIGLVSFCILFIIFIYRVDFSYFVEKIKQKKPPLALIALVIIGLSSLLTLLIAKEINYLISYITFGLQVLSAFLIAYLLNFKRFINLFQNGMLIISLLAIFFDLITIISGTSFSILPNFVSVSDQTYINYFFISFQNAHSGRLQGPFWEPGLFASFLLIAMCFEIVFFKKIRIPYFLSYFFALILTESTFGYLLLFIVIILLIYKKIKSSTIFSILAILIFAFGFSIFVFADDMIPFLAKIFPKVFSKMTDSMGNIYFLDFSRYTSPINNIMLWIQKPIFGHGISTANTLYEINYPNVSQTSTTTFYLTQFGIFGIAFTVFFYIGLFKIKKISIIDKAFLALLFFIIFNKEPHTSIIFEWILMFLMLKEFIDKNETSLLFDEPQPKSISASFAKNDDSSIVKRNVFISYIIKGSALVIGFFSYPIYRKYFSNESTLGVWLAVLSLMSIALTFDFGLGNGLKNKLIRAINYNDTNEQERLISSTYLCSIIISGVIILLSIPLILLVDFNNFLGISKEIINPNILKISSFLVACSISFELTFRNVNSMLQAKQKQGLCNFIPLLSTILLILFALIFKSNNQNILLLAIAITYVFSINLPFLLGSIYTFKKYYKGIEIHFKQVNKNSIKNVMSLGIGFFIIQLLLLCLSGTNEIIVSNVFGSNAVVEFTNYNKPFMMIYSLFSIVTLPYWAIIAKEKEENNYKKVKSNFYKCGIFMLVFVLLMIFLAIIYQPFINLWLGEGAMTVSTTIVILYCVYIFETLIASALTVLANSFSIIKAQIIGFGSAALIKIVLSFCLKYIDFKNKTWSSIVVINIFAYIPLIITLVIIAIKLLAKGKNNEKESS